MGPLSNQTFYNDALKISLLAYLVTLWEALYKWLYFNYDGFKRQKNKIITFKIKNQLLSSLNEKKYKKQIVNAFMKPIILFLR